MDEKRKKLFQDLRSKPSYFIKNLEKDFYMVSDSFVSRATDDVVYMHDKYVGSQGEEKEKYKRKLHQRIQSSFEDGTVECSSLAEFLETLSDAEIEAIIHELSEAP